ncbi:sensor histidine kinase [Robertmurraya andreesenii]|uniref:histidine kinase n=1 Tax=Anoxybacillus andreesenii TaxID=1325932 RepID=A0ABT9V0E4_9BACL|nr:ATP-binding protein [Robertmurraya andreesenii]MDQ0154420.1 signal transduction histidine kinase [Robertmurraya andreesenii]
MGTKKSSFNYLFRKRGLFENTQFRLTLLYSGMLMLFLLLFIAIVYIILYATIFKDQERELEVSVKQEAKNIEQYLGYQNHKGRLRFRNQESIVKDVDQFFYYVVDQSGELVLGDELIPDLRTELLTAISNWNPSKNEILQKTFQVEFSERGLNGKGRNHEFHPVQKTETIRLMIASQPISYRGEAIGMLYIGKEISFAYQVFKWLPTILLGIAILFSLVALVISYYMSKKAMVPITRAFTRQREFVADASHELRTPLSVMLSSINAMEMTLDLEKEDYSHKLLFNMKNEVKRMTGLVGDLLTLARSDSGTIELVNEWFDFRTIAEEVVESVRALAEFKQIKLHFDAPDVLMVNGDSQKLTQLLYILLDNAIKYTPNRGEAQLSLSVKGKELLIFMKDSGIGINQDDYGRIFERFYRADKARTRQDGGHGLGLAIAKWIVEIHKGTIQVFSEVGKGSTFIISIPIIENRN